MTEKTEYKLNLKSFETANATPFYQCTNKGVYYHAFTTDKQGNVTEKPPTRLSDTVKLLGYGVDEGGKHYRVISWYDRLGKENKTMALSMADIGNSWSHLQGMGIAIQAGRGKRDLLADYLMTEGDKKQYLITNYAGWCDNNRAYILPSGEAITNSKDGKEIIYNGDTSQAQYYASRGTLADWQESIARYAAGNSRLSLVLGASFAAPLMRLLDIEGGGFHLFGDSSDGKTTAAKVALSVWGKGDDLKLSWEGTGHGFANIANAKNDNLMVLDEIGQASQRVVSQTAYSVLNGTGKVQGAKEGGNRHINQWRVLLLSTGEKTMEGFINSGHAEWHAGQATRLPNIPANAGKEMGIFDILHDMPNGAELSEHLNQASNEHYGNAGKAFVERLLADTDEAINHVKAVMLSFTTGMSLTGQARRVCNRFALVAGALELANHYGITGLAAGSSSVLIKQCFDDWLEREGTGNRENRQIIEQVEAFMQQNAPSYRFVHWGNTADTPENLAGYKQSPTDTSVDASTEYWIIPAVFKNEICQSFDNKKVANILLDIGWLHRGKEKRLTKQKYGKGRFYVLVGTTNPHDEMTTPFDDD